MSLDGQPVTTIDRGRLDGQVRAVIARRIAAGQYPVGGTLPSEALLATELGVSRVTLRQALATLEDDGLLARRQGRGTFVLEPLPVLECALSKNLGVTEMIERSGLTAGTSDCWTTAPYLDESVASALELEQDDLVALERVRTANGRPIVRTTDVLAREHDAVITEMATQNLSLYALLASHGVEVHHGTATLAPTNADQEVATALNLPTGTTLLALEQVDFDTAGKPVLFSRELWVRRAIRFRVERANELEK